MSRRFMNAVGSKVFKTREDEIAEEQLEIFARGANQQRAEIDFWRGMTKLMLILGLMAGAVATSVAEMRTGASLWVFMKITYSVVRAYL